MKKFVIIFCICLCPLVSQSHSENKKYRIAVILPLSGQIASMGMYVKNGITLAIENLPAEKKQDIEVVFEDDQFDPTKTISAYRKLKTTGKVDAVFVLGSPTANVLTPITERDKTILMAIGASDPAIAIGKKYSFIHWVIPPVLGEVLGQELIRRNFQRIGIISAETSGAIADTDALEESLIKQGKRSHIVHRQDFIKDVVDYRSAILQLEQKKVDAVVAVLYPGALSAFAKQLKVSKLQAELVGMESFEDEAEVKAAQGALTGTWYVNASSPTDAFVSSYQKAYGQHPGWATANAYDALMLTVQGAFEKNFNNDAIVQFLGTIKDYHGAAGTYSSSGDNRFTLPATLKRVTKDGFVNFQNP